MTKSQQEEERVYWELMRDRRRNQNLDLLTSLYPPKPLGWNTVTEPDGAKLSF